MPAQTPTNTGTAYYAQGNRYPPLVRQLLDGAGDPIVLTTATSVTIKVAHASYDPYFSRKPVIVEAGACTITNATLGIVQWVPAAGDTDIVGAFHYVFTITWSGGETQTVPPNTYQTIYVKAPPGGPV